MKPRVLLVSKPVVPPWNDSSKNLVRDLVHGTAAARLTVLTDGSAVFSAEHVEEHALYRGAGRLAPSVRQNARVLGLLLRDRAHDVHHFFFAPNPRTLRIIRAARRLRSPPSIHTICSVPRTFEGLNRQLFADVNVALSAYTKAQLQALGLTNVCHIPPACPPLDAVFGAEAIARCRSRFELAQGAPIFLFAGDLEFSNAADRVAESALALADVEPAPVWVFACRLKTEAARRRQEQLEKRLARLADRARARFFNQVDDMIDLLAAVDLVLLPAETTYAKMDLPLVLLEAMALGRPVLVGDRPPLNELPLSEAGYAVDLQGDALTEQLRAILHAPETLRERGARAAEIVRERYTREAMGAAYAGLYRSLCR